MRECAAVTQNELLTRCMDKRNKVAVDDKTLADADEAMVSGLDYIGNTSFNLTI